MRSRVTALILAIILGILATAGVAIYLNIIAKSSKTEGEKIDVYVAARGISAGKTGGQLLKDGSIEKKTVPRRYLPADAVTSLKTINSKMLASRLSEGETLTFSKFKTLSGAEMLPLRLKNDQLAISFPVDQFSGVAGQVRSGDRVVVMATMKGAAENSEFTRIILTNVPVLTVPPEGKKNSSASQGQTKQSLTIAVDAADLEKLVFAAEEGRLWVALQKGKGKTETTSTTGANMGTLSAGP